MRTAEAANIEPDIAAKPFRALLLNPRFLGCAILGSLAALVLVGLPTDILPNPWFTRMTPIRATDYLLWATSGILTGALLATYLLPGRQRSSVATTSAGTGLLTVFAVGCPICNKLVVALLGVSGALTFFAPIQPLLGAVALGTSFVALRIRLRGAGNACAIASREPTPRIPPRKKDAT